MRPGRAFLCLVLLLAPLPAAAQADMAVETAQVEDLRSIREIKRLQAEWGHMALAGNWDGMARLAAPDVVLALSHGELNGQGALEAWLRTTQGGGSDGIPAGKLNLRFYMSPVITLAQDGQSATGRWHEIAMTAQAGASADWLGVTHVVDYRKAADGWRIARIRPYRHFAGSFAEGWSHDAETLERAPYHYTPDQAGQLLPHRRAATARSKEALEREASLLLGQSEAQNIVNAYGYYLDREMFDDIVDLFAGDAAIDVAGQGVWEGKDGVRRFLTRFGEAGLDFGELNDRPQLMPLASISADGATALIRNVELGMTGQHGGEGFWSAAVQTFLLRRGEDGKWRIALMHRSPLMRADYFDGPAKPLPAALPLAPGGEPDGPSQLGDLAYPGNTFALPPLGPDLVMPASGRGEPEILPDALARAEAFDGAENVSNAYGYDIDQFAWRRTAGLFARDGWKELSYIGTFIGKDRVLGSLIQRYGEGGPNDAFQAIHQKTQPYVTVLDGGKRAFVRNRLMQFNSGSGAPGGSWISGIYENQIVKEDGIWRIHGMDLDYFWLADYATGWMGIDPDASKRFSPGEEAIAAFGPDAPLRGETFAPFPRIAPLGFHFANPVSGRKPDVQLQWSDGRRFPTTE